MNYYPRHLGDYAKDTGHLSMLEHGAYTLLLDRYYSTDAAIPADQTYRLTRCRSREERTAVDSVLAEFFTLKESWWTNSRADKEIAKALVKIGSAQTNGQLGGRPKKKPDATDEKPSGFPPGSEDGTQTKALQSPITNNQAPDKEREGATATVAARGARLSTDWVLPEDWSNWARAERPDLDPAKVAERFADHWAAKPGADGRKLDWLATWRNWVRAERAPAGAAGKPTETAYARSMREKYEILCPDIAARPPGSALRSVVNFDQEIADVAARRLG